MSAPCPRFGFELRLRAAAPLTPESREAPWRAFIGAVEARGLVAGGGAHGEWLRLIHREGGQAVEADRAALLAWAASRPELANASAGPLVDLSEEE